MSTESVRGETTVIHFNGERCVHSRNKPYCDGSHKKAGFRSD